MRHLELMDVNLCPITFSPYLDNWWGHQIFESRVTCDVIDYLYTKNIESFTLPSVFLTHSSNANYLPGFYKSGTLAGNGLRMKKVYQ